MGYCQSVVADVTGGIQLFLVGFLISLLTDLKTLSSHFNVILDLKGLLWDKKRSIIL